MKVKTEQNNISWSYSSISLFKQCPKKYYHLKVAKDYIEPQSQAMSYGTIVHKAAEKFVRDDVDIPEKFAYMRETIEHLKNKKGDKLCELRMAITQDATATTWMAKNVWLRSIADLIIKTGDKARIIDYKTGKSSRYADTKQLDLLALCTFIHFPEVEKIRAALLFLVCNDLVTRSYTRSDMAGLMGEWTANYSWLEKTYAENVWNAKPNFTCEQFCPVTTCAHNGRFQ